MSRPERVGACAAYRSVHAVAGGSASSRSAKDAGYISILRRGLLVVGLVVGCGSSGAAEARGEGEKCELSSECADGLTCYGRVCLTREQQSVEAAKGPSDGVVWNRCHAKQTRFLKRCAPTCDSTGRIAEEYEKCLSTCALAEFGEAVPACGSRP